MAKLTFGHQVVSRCSTKSGQTGPRVRNGELLVEGRGTSNDMTGLTHATAANSPEGIAKLKETTGRISAEP